MSFVCWNCGQDLESTPRPVSRHAQCPQCFEAVHSCLMCRHHNVNVTGQCEDERADPPTRRENANFCEYYKPRFSAYVKKRGQNVDAARAKLDALFGSSSSANADDPASPAPVPPEPDKADAAKAALEALFSSPPKK